MIRFASVSSVGRAVDPASPLGAWLRAIGAAARHALRWTAHHTGLPVIVVAAIALVLSWRLARSLARVCVEVAVALALLLLATKAGWIRW